MTVTLFWSFHYLLTCDFSSLENSKTYQHNQKISQHIPVYNESLMTWIQSWAVIFLLHSPVTLGVKKLLRKAYGRTINIPELPLAVWPKPIVVHQTQSNGLLIDPLITYAALMRLTPVYWLLFAWFLTLLHGTPLSASFSQLRILEQCRAMIGT